MFDHTHVIGKPCLDFKMAADAGASGGTGPQDMEAILKEMGVTEYDPNVNVGIQLQCVICKVQV